MPGQVDLYYSPTYGILDLGRHPTGTDNICERMVTDLTVAGFASRATSRITEWKYAKLLDNLGNAAEAACGARSEIWKLVKLAQDEARECLNAASISFVPAAEVEERRRLLPGPRSIGGHERGGGSSWQSLARMTGTIEADYLNGEIVLLGRQFGLPTPVNQMFQRVANRMAQERVAPASLSVGDLERLLMRSDDL